VENMDALLRVQSGLSMTSTPADVILLFDQGEVDSANCVTIDYSCLLAYLIGSAIQTVLNRKTFGEVDTKACFHDPIG